MLQIRCILTQKLAKYLKRDREVPFLSDHPVVWYYRRQWLYTHRTASDVNWPARSLGNKTLSTASSQSLTQIHQINNKWQMHWAIPLPSDKCIIPGVEEKRFMGQCYIRLRCPVAAEKVSVLTIGALHCAAEDKINRLRYRRGRG